MDKDQRKQFKSKRNCNTSGTGSCFERLEGLLPVPSKLVLENPTAEAVGSVKLNTDTHQNCVDRNSWFALFPIFPECFFELVSNRQIHPHNWVMANRGKIQGR